MSINSLFFIFLISFALVSNKISPNNKKSCFVEIEVEYSDEYDYIFNQFPEMFEEQEVNKLENPSIHKEESEYEEVDDEEEYTKVDHFIPSDIKRGCGIESEKPAETLITHFRKLCKIDLKIVFINLVTKYAQIYLKQTMSI